MSAIIDFYEEVAPDDQGHMLFHMIGIQDHQFEHSHTLIQWLFPTVQPSNFNVDAPILTEEDIKLFKASPKLQSNLHNSFLRFIKFLGLKYENDKVIKADNFAKRYPECWGYWNHNWLRISRAISSLRTLGLMKEAWALYEGCLEIARTEAVPITQHTFDFWKAAVTGSEFPKFGG